MSLAYMHRTRLYETYRDCIVPADEWDGDTGIDALLEEYYADHPEKRTAYKSPPMVIKKKRKSLKTATKKRVRYAPAEIIDGEKECPVCQQVKPVSEYYVAKNLKSGYTTLCKYCYDSKYKKHKRCI